MQEIERFLCTGQHDVLGAAWPGDGIILRAGRASAALRGALIATVLDRTKHAIAPDGLEVFDLVAFTRKKVEPMVRGLFPGHEQATVLDVLQRSVVFLTPLNIETVLRETRHLSTAWNLANLYLASVDAELLSRGTPQIVGLSEETTCFVSVKYFCAGSRFDDVVMHEVAHIFHNCKREQLGLREIRGREWLLEIDYSKRETFAYACEALSRILELGNSAPARRALLAEIETGSKPPDERVDAGEYLAILRAAVASRNGWKRILERCAPPPRRTRMSQQSTP